MLGRKKRGRDRDRHVWRAEAKAREERKGRMVGEREKKGRGKRGKKKGGGRRVC